MALVLNTQRMEKSSPPSRGISESDFQAQGANAFLNNAPTPSAELSLYCLSRALFGNAISLSNAAAANGNNNLTLFRHPSLGLPAVQGGGWQARSSAPATNAGAYAPPTSTDSVTPTSQMVLSLPPRSLRNFEQSLNPVSATLFSRSDKTAYAEEEAHVEKPVSASPAQSVKAAPCCEAESHKPVENNNTNKAKEDRTMPCRARGMPKDHNAQTACFHIPADIAHGEGLHCSHPGCRAKGIRFRFCSVCSVPVAKRNFSTRHHHGDLLEQSIREENGLVGVRSEADEDLAKRREMLLREKRGRVVTTSCSSSSCRSASTASSISEDDSVESSSAGKKRCRVNDNESATKAHKKRQKRETNAAAAANELESYSRDFHEKWMKLLEERPRRQDEARLERWIDRVVALSEKMSTNPPLRAQVEYLHDTESPPQHAHTPEPLHKGASSKHGKPREY